MADARPHSSTSRDRAAAALAAHPMFHGLDRPAFDQLLRFMHVVTAGKGDTLFRKGDPGEFLMLVVEGGVKIVSPAADGKEVLLNLLHEGEMFGEVALFDGLERSADAVAHSPCTLAKLDRRDVIAVIERHPSVALNFISFLCKTLRHVSGHLDDVMFLDVSARLARAIDRVGAKQGGTVNLTQRELAQSIGVSRESVNQVLRAWQLRNFIRLDKGRIRILDPAAVERLCAGAH